MDLAPRRHPGREEGERHALLPHGCPGASEMCTELPGRQRRSWRSTSPRAGHGASSASRRPRSFRRAIHDRTEGPASAGRGRARLEARGRDNSAPLFWSKFTGFKVHELPTSSGPRLRVSAVPQSRSSLEILLRLKTCTHHVAGVHQAPVLSSSRLQAAGEPVALQSPSAASIAAFMRTSELFVTRTKTSDSAQRAFRSMRTTSRRSFSSSASRSHQVLRAVRQRLFIQHSPPLSRPRLPLRARPVRLLEAAEDVLLSCPQIA